MEMMIRPSLARIAALLAVCSFARPACPSSSSEEPISGGETELRPVVRGNRSVRLPLHFEENRGQSAERVQFLARSPGALLGLESDEIVLRWDSGDESPTELATSRRAAEARIELLGARKAARLEGERELSSRSNYLFGRDTNRWVVGARHYEQVVSKDLYPGIDLVCHAGPDGDVELDWILAPEADPGVISLRFEGVDELRLDDAGELVARVGTLRFRLSRPRVYQCSGDGRRDVDGAYVVEDGSTVGVRLGAYDRSETLIIDPILSYSTYLGGGGQDLGHAVAVDSQGNAYVAGQSLSTDFPGNADSVTSTGAEFVAYVAKLDPAGSLIFATFLSGTDLVARANIEFDRMAVRVDGAGFIYLAGDTTAPDFPTVNAVQDSLGGLHDAFVTKLGPDGATIVYSTYLGGSKEDHGRSIAIDAAGSVIVVGVTESPDFPTVGAYQSGLAGLVDAFVTKLDPSGSSIEYSTYLGGHEPSPGGAFADVAFDVAVDGAGNAYLTGFTGAPDFPTLNALQPALGGGQHDAFVAELSVEGALVYSSYLGGSSTEEGLGIAVDEQGAAYVTGWTASVDFPMARPLQGARSGAVDAFVSKLAPGGGSLVYSTFLGGTATEYGDRIAVDGRGVAHVIGTTSSPDFPTVNAVQPVYGGGASDAFVASVKPDGSSLSDSTFLGGSGRENPYLASVGIGVTASSQVLVAGSTDSVDFPLEAPLQSAPGGSVDAFVSKLVTGPELRLDVEPVSGRDVLSVSLRNGSTSAVDVELKLWFRFDGGMGPIYPDGLQTRLAPGETRTLPTLPLPSAFVFPGSEVGGRLLDPVTGDAIDARLCRSSPCR
jgi:Beta-propeller repeat